jgi:hypothetical protein
MFSSRICATFIFFIVTPALCAQLPVSNMIADGDFQSSGGFTSTFTYRDPATTSPMTVFDPGTYTIAPNMLSPIVLHPDPSVPSFFDHTFGNASGMYMIVNGSTAPNKAFWSTNLTVQPNSFYTFSMWDAVWNNSQNHLPELQVSINGISLGVGIPNMPLGTWTNYTVTWFSGSTTSAQIDLSDLNTDNNGNDFALDDLSFTSGLSAVPEPGTLALMGGALLGCGGYWAYRRRSNRIQDNAIIKTS